MTYHADNGLFFAVNKERSLVTIIKTDGKTRALKRLKVVSAFLATSAHGENASRFWPFYQDWSGGVDLSKAGADEVARIISRMPKTEAPRPGTAFRERREVVGFVKVVDSHGKEGCMHEVEGAYGNRVYNGNRDGSGAVSGCPCGWRSHTERRMCRHEWVLTQIYLHNMEQKYRCRLCNTRITTGGCALDDPRRPDPCERLEPRP